MARMRKAKTSTLPACRVQPERRARYDRALAKCQKDAPDMTQADWIRQACDEKAERDLQAR